jgi:hypothetical protein
MAPLSSKEKGECGLAHVSNHLKKESKRHFYGTVFPILLFLIARARAIQ